MSANLPGSDRPAAAGRRALIATLAAAPFVRHAPAQERELFALGIASGSPTASSVVLWTRLIGDTLPPEVAVRWELAHDEAFTRIAARGIETARTDDAHSVHAEVRGLDPARAYWYRFEALGARSATGRTTTAPAPGAAVSRVVISTASCQRFEHGYYAAWRDVTEHPPDLVLFLGDYIYEYASPANALRRVNGGRTVLLPDYRQRYADYKSDPQLQAAHAACPWIVIWDDHEVENDYAGLIGERLQPDFARQRAAAYRAWWEHMPLPPSMRPRSDGTMTIHGSLDWGTLARLHWLDDRQYRDVQLCPRPGRAGSSFVALKDCPDLSNPQRSLLGTEQERWLDRNWSLNHRWNLLAQQTLMARFSRSATSEDGKPAGTYWTDGWDGYPAARTRLLHTIADRRVPGAVVLGGDVHGNYVADLHLDFDDPRSPIVASEFCGTSITSFGGPQEIVDKALPHNPHVHHARIDERGTTRLVIEREQLQATLRVVADINDPASAVRSARRFAVDPRQAGVRAP